MNPIPHPCSMLRHATGLACNTKQRSNNRFAGTILFLIAATCYISLSHLIFFKIMQEDPIPLEELFANGAEIRDGNGKAIAIIRSVLAIVSLISSSALIRMVRRSRAGFTTTYNRILLGMSAADIIYSLSLAHFNFTAPSDMSYMVWNARGNQATCSTQGFMSLLGATNALLYSCSLNLYSLSVVKYQKPDYYIRAKIEPFLHGVPIVLGLTVGVTLVANKNTNSSSGGGGNCYMPTYDPPHCTGYEDGNIREGFEIPCGRGSDGAVLFAYLSMFITTFVTPIIVGISLGMIYRAVSQQEKKLARYGAGTFTATVPPSSASGAEDRANRASLTGLGLSRIMSSALPTLRRRFSSAPPQDHQKSRIVLQRAFAFSVAYSLTWLFNIVGNCFSIADMKWPTAIWYLSNIFNPLQGVFNFLIFIHPKVKRAKSQGGNNITWRQAFAKVFWPREGNTSSGTGGGRPKQRAQQTPPRAEEAEEGENENQTPQIMPRLHEISPAAINLDETENLVRDNDSTPNNFSLEPGDVELGEQERRLQIQQNAGQNVGKRNSWIVNEGKRNSWIAVECKRSSSVV